MKPGLAACFLCWLLAACATRNPIQAPLQNLDRGKPSNPSATGASSLAELRSSQAWRFASGSEAQSEHSSQKSEQSQSPAALRSGGSVTTSGWLGSRVDLPAWHGFGIAGLIFGAGWYLGRRLTAPGKTIR